MSKLLSCVLASYPDLDSDIANYIGAMLDEQAEVELLRFWKSSFLKDIKNSKGRL